ncbi:helix-turn-helix transcriptional regulator [Gordonia neofelifaecis]|uniref:Transcriptional regulator-like protein n=1 Tax=Gordonia neofelifaecis NRRL B-59395 TaxID=644548 RepID=F1YGQ0_9ACTN|nr:WYL domain-containing protein [Gordonia neofelifaecis]EGD56198.1 transcriptional regulator-like protein [Gordonia neofelifaecis NRRL B-59395]
MTGPNPTRLSRLLAMVPYFLARPGIKLSTAAADLGLTPSQLQSDLEQLYVCGLPGYGPEHLIDIQFWDGYVSVVFAAGIDHPLRLTGPEANVLLMALNMLSETRGAAEADAVRSAIAKIEEAMGSTHRAVSADAVAVDEERPVDAVIRRAMEQRRALRLTYYTASRDEVTERTVDPILIKAVDGNTYLEAWCRSSEGIRLFRFDRIESAEETGEESRPPADVVPPEPTGFSVLTGELPTARIEIDPDAVWLLEYYAAEADEELAEEPEGPISATIRYGSPQWLARFLLGFGGRVRLLEDVDGTSSLVATGARAARDRYRA